VETIKFAGNDATLSRMRTIPRDVDGYGQWFLLSENGSTRITGFLSQVITTESIPEVILRNATRIKLHFLKADYVGVALANKFVKAFFPTSSKTIYVPGYQFNCGCNDRHLEKKYLKKDGWQVYWNRVTIWSLNYYSSNN
jgi:hypothetical protein